MKRLSVRQVLGTNLHILAAKHQATNTNGITQYSTSAMNLNHPRIVAAEYLMDGYCRLECDVVYDNGEGEMLWVEVPTELDIDAQSADPWIAMLIPLAFTLGENIVTEAPIDTVLLENIRALQAVWSMWDKRHGSVEIHGPRHIAFQDTPGIALALFSGGVDSYCALLDRVGPDKRGKLDALLTVWGLDIALSREDEFATVAATASETAIEFGLKHYFIATNLRETRFTQAAWSRLSHGSALAGLALFLGRSVAEVIVASTHTYPDFSPWGSHFLTDPLLSTSNTRLIHDGATLTRVEKTQRVAANEFALRHLRVCWKEGLATNCCQCSKCLRTMVTLELMGVLGKATSFPKSLDYELLPKVYHRDDNDHTFFLEVRDYARRLGREELAGLLDRAIRSSQRLRPLMLLVDSFEKTPILWRAYNPIRNRLLRGRI